MMKGKVDNITSDNFADTQKMTAIPMITVVI